MVAKNRCLKVDMSLNEEDSDARSAVRATKYRRDMTHDILRATTKVTQIMKCIYLRSLF